MLDSEAEECFFPLKDFSIYRCYKLKALFLPLLWRQSMTWDSTELICFRNFHPQTLRR